MTAVSPKIFVSLIHFAFLLGYALLVGALLWHYRQYSLPKDKARWVIGTFLFFAITLAILSTLMLYLIDWSALLERARY